MLVVLALACNEPVALDDLTDALWADDPPRSALANMRSYASVLRRDLGDRLTSSSVGYQLTMADDELDVTEFNQLAAAGRQALKAHDFAAAADLLAKALSLWRGPAAAQGLPARGALQVALSNLDHKRLMIFDELMQARLQLGQHVELIPELRMHVYRYPLREHSWAQLMIALHRSGDTAGALATFANARKTIREQLGLEPGEELSVLQRAILNRSPDMPLDLPGLST